MLDQKKTNIQILYYFQIGGFPNCCSKYTKTNIVVIVNVITSKLVVMVKMGEEINIADFLRCFFFVSSPNPSTFISIIVYPPTI